MKKAHPIDTKPPMKPSEAFSQPLPRTALAALNPEAERKLPFGAHPDDKRFKALQ